MLKVEQKLKSQASPSAFQIRIGGCKGVVSRWSNEFLKGKGFKRELVVRESMWKYQSDFKNIEVLEHAHPLPLHLNQQVLPPFCVLSKPIFMQIIILLNFLGVGDGVFMDLLRNVIVDMGRMFVDEDTAIAALKMVASDQVRPLQSARFRFASDSYFRDLMKAVYRSISSTVSLFNSHLQEANEGSEGKIES